MGKLKSNILYSSILTTANYIFPLLTFPYITRVLEVSNYGLVNFIDGIVNYAILICAMGIGATGIKSVAANRTASNLSETYSTLLSLNMVTSLIGIAILCALTVFIPELRENYDLMGLGILKIIFTVFLIEWFFKGLEEFKYITVRSLIVRTIYVLSVFLFVRNRCDIFIYYMLTVGCVVINAITNTWYSKRFVRFSFRNITFRKYYKSFFQMGLYMILVSFYNTVNVVYLGFVSNPTEVGYYTTATKLYSIFLSLFTAFTGVMLPRMSALIASDNKAEFIAKINKSALFLLSFTLPLICFSILEAKRIIGFVAGPGYEGAIIPMQIVMFLLFLVGFNQIFIMQILMPTNNDKIILRNTITASVTGIILNIVLVPYFFSIGSAFVLIGAEIIQFVMGFIACKEILNVKTIVKTFLYCIPWLILLCISIRLINIINVDDFIILLLSGFCTILINFVLLQKQFPGTLSSIMRHLKSK